MCELYLEGYMVFKYGIVCKTGSALGEVLPPLVDINRQVKSFEELSMFVTEGE